MLEILASGAQDNGYQEAGIFALLVLMAIVMHLWAKRVGFFDFVHKKAESPFPSFKVSAQAFAIYISFTFILPSLLVGFFQGVLSIVRFQVDIGIFATVIHAISIAFCLIALGLFLHSVKQPFIGCIWKKDPKKSILSDLFFGLIGFLISYPVVLVAGNFFDWLVQVAFKLISYEQVAVKYLKNTKGNMLEMTVALFTIVIFAPVVEELLFRGFLQSFLRRYLKPRSSIIISGFLFALFHFSFSQGFGNISVILTLFVLGWYLGVIYERQGSLLSVIFFHALFNMTSAWRVLFEIAGGT